jgi:hypothetical protein
LLHRTVARAIWLLRERLIWVTRLEVKVLDVVHAYMVRYSEVPAGKYARSMTGLARDGSRTHGATISRQLASS